MTWRWSKRTGSSPSTGSLFLCVRPLSTSGFASTVASFAFTAGGLRDRAPAVGALSDLASGGLGVRARTRAGLGVAAFALGGTGVTDRAPGATDLRGAAFATDAFAFFDPGATDVFVRGARTDLRGRLPSSLIEISRKGV
jgi:hypothetical protein